MHFSELIYTAKTQYLVHTYIYELYVEVRYIACLQMTEVPVKLQYTKLKIRIEQPCTIFDIFKNAPFTPQVKDVIVPMLVMVKR